MRRRIFELQIAANLPTHWSASARLLPRLLASSLRLGLISTLADVVVNKPKVSSDLYWHNLYIYIYNFDIWDVILILDMINAVLSPFGPPLQKKVKQAIHNL